MDAAGAESGTGGARLAVQGARMVPPALDPLDPLDRNQLAQQRLFGALEAGEAAGTQAGGARTGLGTSQRETEAS